MATPAFALQKDTPSGHSATLFPPPKWLKDDLERLRPLVRGNLLVLFHDDIRDRVPSQREQSFLTSFGHTFDVDAGKTFPAAVLHEFGENSGGLYFSDGQEKTSPKNAAILLFPQALKPTGFVHRLFPALPSSCFRPQGGVSPNRIAFLHEFGHHLLDGWNGPALSMRQQEHLADTFCLEAMADEHAKNFLVSYRTLQALFSPLRPEASAYWYPLSLVSPNQPLCETSELAAVLELKLLAMGEAVTTRTPQHLVKTHLWQEQECERVRWFDTVHKDPQKARVLLDNLSRIGDLPFAMPHTAALRAQTIEAISFLAPSLLARPSSLRRRAVFAPAKMFPELLHPTPAIGGR